MNHRLLPILVVFLPLLSTATALAQPAAPALDTALHWSGADSATQVFLVPGEGSRCRLFVLGGDGLTVTYRTQVNSTRDVATPLHPREPLKEGVREYEFTHKFSRMTIWMALEFRKGKERDEGLTRTFSGSLGTVVGNGEYLKGK